LNVYFRSFYMPGKYQIHAKKDNIRTAGKNLNNKVSRNTYFILSGIVIYACILYYRSVYNDFVDWDDTEYIFKNYFIRNFSWQGIKNIFSVSYYANYHPLTTLTWLIEFRFWGFSADKYHLNNLVIHLLNIILTFVLFRSLTGNNTISLLTALFFAIHPLNVESVAWISERKGLLCAFFYLFSLIAYTLYLKRDHNIKFLAFSVFAFILALLSKAMAVSLPFVLILIDYFYFERKILKVKCLLEKMPYFILTVIFAAASYYTQSSGGGIAELSGNYSFFNRLFLIPYAFSFYLINFIFPLRLSVFHYFPEVKNGFLPWEYYLSFLFVIFILWFFIRAGKSRKYILFGFLFFIIAIMPVLQVIPIGRVVVSERYAYIPYLGLFLMLFTYIDREIKTIRSFSKYIFLILGVVSIFYSVLTWNRIKVWQNGITLWEDFISENPDHYFGYYGLAGANYCKEIADYNRSFDLQNSNSAGKGFTDAKGIWMDMDEAIKNLTRCINLNSSFVSAYRDRGNAYLDNGNLENAMADFKKVIGFYPEDQIAYNNMGVINARLNKYYLAIEDYNKSLSINPLNPITYFNRGLIYLSIKDTSRACEDFKKAKSLNYENAGKYVEKLCR
jgi:protein O-mannosyl-transferase